MGCLASVSARISADGCSLRIAFRQKLLEITAWTSDRSGDSRHVDACLYFSMQQFASLLSLVQVAICCVRNCRD